MRIVVLIDIEAFFNEDPQLEGKLEAEHTKLEFHVTESLRHQGHKVFIVPVYDDIRHTIAELTEIKPKLVFNLTEHFGGDRLKDTHIAAMLELLGIPFTGTGPKGMLICRDKALCKRVLSHHRVRVPNFSSCPIGRKYPIRKLNFPVIVKPLLTDGSEGISRASLVTNESDLRERISFIHEHLHGPAICEEFIVGRELYVTVIGNKKLTVFPPREVLYGKVDEPGAPSFTTSRVKMNADYRKKWDIQFVKASLTESELNLIENSSKRIFKLLYLRDYCRLDMRLTPEGQLYCLEANPNPDLTMGDEVSEAASHAGFNYDELLTKIMRLALSRHKGS